MKEPIPPVQPAFPMPRQPQEYPASLLRIQTRAADPANTKPRFDHHKARAKRKAQGKARKHNR